MLFRGTSVDFGVACHEKGFPNMHVRKLGRVAETQGAEHAEAQHSPSVALDPVSVGST
jgi:hypothetical protein